MSGGGGGKGTPAKTLHVEVAVERGGVFIVGESIKCTVTISNTSPENSDRIAWATGQISGRISVEERCVLLQREIRHEVPNSKSALSRHVGEGCFLSSDPEILLCDLQLKPLQTKTLTFSGKVPTDCPPSFRGTYVKYSYMVIVGLQRVGEEVSIVSLPIRIINLPGVKQITENSRGSHHPFAPKDEGVKFEDYFMDKVQSLCCKRPRSYEVKTADKLVCIVRLMRGAFRLGDPIDINLEFGEVMCIQVTAKLQVLETINPESEKKENTPPRITTHDTQTIQCIHTRSTALSLHIPLNVVNSFSTNVILVRWQVCFDFVVSQLKPSSEVVDAGLTSVSEKGLDCDWRPLAHLPVSTLSWDMSVTVVPSLPQYISTVAWQRTHSKLNI